MRYHGQAFEVSLPVQLTDFADGAGLPGLARDFHAAHEKLFAFSMDTELELVNLRAVALGKATSAACPTTAARRWQPDQGQAARPPNVG
ncbi:hypothetical protein [Pseudomonas sp. TH10]|uniref:hypothetical protein n=1 Tax=Pseudomonas sp. TH10 TaxID=2796376 RepID=UPI0019133222|nr:hypothetical protein [Pseudomonas sp. TH10]MBK5517916.1 hypothetical protein [Pseudomonas sp. TH10]